MITDPYTFLSAILPTKTNITSLLSTFKDTSIPLIQGGVLAETETGLPAITFRVDTATRIQSTDTQFFIVNCYGATERDSYIVARAVVDEFNEQQEGIDGFVALTTCSMLSSVGDPTTKEINTPVEFRVLSIKQL